MVSEFDAKAFREQLTHKRRDDAEAAWHGRISSDKAAETGRFAKRLIHTISPSELLAREFPTPIQRKFAQVVSLSNQLNITLKHPDEVGNLLEQGFNDTQDILTLTDVRIIGKGIDIKSAIASATHPQTLQSVSNLAIHNEEAMRNRIRGRSGLRTTIDPATGVRFVDERIESPIGGGEHFNGGCPFASKQALIEHRFPDASPIFLTFVAYAGEIAARSAAMRES